MKKLKVVMPKVFVSMASLLLIGLSAALLSQIPALNGAELGLGVLGGAFGYETMKSLVAKLTRLN